MKRLSVFAVILLGSCATPTPKGFLLPDGRTGHTAFCNGRGNSMATCYSLAADFCGGKYEVVDKDQSSSVVGVNGIVAPTVERNLYFTCEVSPANRSLP